MLTMVSREGVDKSILNDGITFNLNYKIQISLLTIWTQQKEIIEKSTKKIHKYLKCLKAFRYSI